MQKSQTLGNCWYPKDITNIIFIKDLYKTKILSQNLNINITNKLTRIIRMVEKMYYANKFNLALGNIKKTWDIIKNLTLGCDHVNSQPVTEIKVDNNFITDSNIMANKFNSFFKCWPIPCK